MNASISFEFNHGKLFVSTIGVQKQFVRTIGSRFGNLWISRPNQNGKTDWLGSVEAAVVAVAVYSCCLVEYRVVCKSTTSTLWVPTPKLDDIPAGKPFIPVGTWIGVDKEEEVDGGGRNGLKSRCVVRVDSERLVGDVRGEVYKSADDLEMRFQCGDFKCVWLQLLS